MTTHAHPALPGTPRLWRTVPDIPKGESLRKRHEAITRSLPLPMLERAHTIATSPVPPKDRERLTRLLVDWTESLVHEQIRAERVVVAKITPTHPHALERVTVTAWDKLDIIPAGWLPLIITCDVCGQPVGEHFLIERDVERGAWLRLTHVGRSPVVVSWLGVHRLTLEPWQSIDEPHAEIALRHPIEYVHHVPTPVHVYANAWLEQSAGAPPAPTKQLPAAGA